MNIKAEFIGLFFILFIANMNMAIASKLTSPMEVGLQATVQSDGLLHVVTSLRNQVNITNVRIILQESGHAAHISGNDKLQISDMPRQNGWLPVMETVYNVPMKTGQTLKWKVILTAVAGGGQFSKVAYAQYPPQLNSNQKPKKFRDGYQTAPSRHNSK